jgi:hypothetical protein
MTITDAQIVRFQALYKQSFGRELNQEQAQTLGLSLLNLIHQTYQPITKQEYQTVLKRQNVLKQNN